MMKVLFVGPATKEKITNTRWVTAPLGVHRIASYLKNHNIYTSVWDINIDNDDFETRVGVKDWDIVAFSSTEATMEYDLSLIHKAKKIRPNAILLAGGTGATLNYQEYFNHSPLDMVIQGEGEFPMFELCQMIEEKGYANSPIHMIPGVIFRQRARILTQEDYWNISKDLDIADMQANLYWNKTAALYDNPDINEINTFRLYTQNFCPMNCAFCTLTRLRKYACGKHTQVISLTVGQIIELIKKVLNTYKDCRQIFFVDDDFFLSKQRGISFCKTVIELKRLELLPRYLQFLCLTNINRIDESNIDLIKEAGFRVLSIGVESVSQFVLDSLDKKQTVDRIWKTTELILSKGVKPYYTLILFSPEGRVQDLIDDLRGFRKLGEIGVGLSIEPYFIPLKGTRLSEEGYPERKRRVDIEGTDEYIYKGFAWLPKNEEVRKVFDRFEIIYAKFRKYMMQNSTTKHMEKNWQAYVILDALEYTLMEMNYLEVNFHNKVYIHLGEISKIESCSVDIVGAVIK